MTPILLKCAFARIDAQHHDGAPGSQTGDGSFPGSPVREYAVDVISATEPVPSIADGVERKLDPRFIGVQRVSRWLFVGPFALIVLIPVALNALFSASGMLMKAGPLVLWAAFTGLLVWWAQAWPAMSYRHSSYRVDPLGIEIRRGVVWRRVINVSRSRVQHTDVSQGPLERGSDLGTLVIFTAGTHYARVHLPGLQHATALRIRDHLLPGGSDDAV